MPELHPSVPRRYVVATWVEIWGAAAREAFRDLWKGIAAVGVFAAVAGLSGSPMTMIAALGAGVGASGVFLYRTADIARRTAALPVLLYAERQPAVVLELQDLQAAAERLDLPPALLAVRTYLGLRSVQRHVDALHRQAYGVSYVEYRG